MTTYTPDGITLTPFQCLAKASKQVGSKIVLPSGGVCQGVILEDNCVMVRYQLAGNKSSEILIFTIKEDGSWEMSQVGKTQRTPTFRELRNDAEDRAGERTGQEDILRGGGTDRGRKGGAVEGYTSPEDIEDIERVLRIRDKRLRVTVPIYGDGPST